MVFIICIGTCTPRGLLKTPLLTSQTLEIIRAFRESSTPETYSAKRELQVVPIYHLNENSGSGISGELQRLEKSKGILRSAWTPEFLSSASLSKTWGVCSTSTSTLVARVQSNSCQYRYPQSSLPVQRFFNSFLVFSSNFSVFLKCNVALEIFLEVQRCTPRKLEKLVFPSESWKMPAIPSES